MWRPLDFFRVALDFPSAAHGMINLQLVLPLPSH